MVTIADYCTLGVVPVLVGPLQALLALLPALLVGLAAFLAALFTPTGLRRFLRFFWSQKLFSLLLLALAASWITGWPWRSIFRGSQAALGIGLDASSDWPTFRGDPSRQGSGPDQRDPSLGVTVWSCSTDPTVYSSPAIAGDLVIFSTAADISPFNPTGRGAIVAVDAKSGSVQWRYAPEDYRATFSSPVVSDGLVVCGEGLHQVQDARITCLDLNGRLQWEFRTASHVESTAAIADGRVFVGAGADGFYCLDLRGDGKGGPRVVWHLDGQEFPDCESSPLVVDDLVVFGLGEGGKAVCAVDARTGELQWRVPTPHPVFTAPTLIPGTDTAGPKLAIAMGNGNFVQTAAQIRDQKLAQLRDSGASADAIREAERQLAPGGQVWCLDSKSQEVEWRFLVDDTILGAIAARDGRLYFGCRDGALYCLSNSGQLLVNGHLREPIVSSPALGRDHLYLTSSSGRLFACDLLNLRPVWDASLSDGENFTSSPVISHGHVYVGSQQQGLLCVGTDGQAPANLWNRGAFGGSADQDALPTLASVVGHWPEQAGDFEIKPCLTAADGQIIAVVQTGSEEHLTKLEFSAKSDSTAKILWQAPSSVLVAFPPLVTGDQVVTLENSPGVESPRTAANPAAVDRHVRQLVARDLDSGHQRWQISLPPFEVREWTCDARWIYLVGQRDIAVIWARDGMPGCVRTLDAKATVSIALVDDLVLLADGRSYSALDSDSGINLWEMAAAQSPARVLDALGAQFLAVVAPAEQAPQIQLRRVLDGALVWQAPWPGSADIRWGRLSAEYALVASSSGSWQAYRLADGSRIELADDAATRPEATDVAQRFRPGALLHRSQVIDVQRAGWRIHGLQEGSSQEWLPLEEAPWPISPLVATRGRVYFVDDQGQIVGIGPRGSSP